MSSQEFANRVDKNVNRIYNSVTQLIQSSKLSDNETADRDGLELVLHSTLIVTSVEDLLRLVAEIKLARLTMDWKNQDKIVAEQSRKYKEQEKSDRERLKRVYEEVTSTLVVLDNHLNASKAKKSRRRQ